METFLTEFFYNFSHNLFKPLLLFFYMGFLVPILGINLVFPPIIYQGLTIYLLIAIGWHGGEELANLPVSQLSQAGGFMIIGFVTNLIIGFLAYFALRAFTRLRKVDAATVAGYYGSDSAGTFVTCLGVLAATHVIYESYMPVMLAVMEIPGCLVALYLVSRMRRQGMDATGLCPDEDGYNQALSQVPVGARELSRLSLEGGMEYVPAYAEAGSIMEDPRSATYFFQAVTMRASSTLRRVNHSVRSSVRNVTRTFDPKLLHEVFLNPGIYLLFAAILIGFVSRKQGVEVTQPDDALLLNLFQGALCFFLLEMGITAASKLKDLRRTGWRFIAFGLVAPNFFAMIGITVAHAYSMATGQPFALGTYALFAVLCAAASYIAVPAVQRLAIPESSPTLPLAASLGLTFSYNVTVGIPLYLQIAKVVIAKFPVA